MSPANQNSIRTIVPRDMLPDRWAKAVGLSPEEDLSCNTIACVLSTNTDSNPPTDRWTAKESGKSAVAVLRENSEPSAEHTPDDDDNESVNTVIGGPQSAQKASTDDSTGLSFYNDVRDRTLKLERVMPGFNWHQRLPKEMEQNLTNLSTASDGMRTFARSCLLVSQEDWDWWTGELQTRVELQNQIRKLSSEASKFTPWQSRSAKDDRERAEDMKIQIEDFSENNMRALSERYISLQQDSGR